MKNIRERKIDAFEFDKRLYPNFPTNMLVELTNACNHKCLFCANRKMTRKISHIDKKFLKTLLKEAFKLGTREVGFYSTGEPLISKNLSSYISRAKEIGYEYVYITTNGALAIPEKAVEIIEAGIDSIKFSINAGTKETYKIIHGFDDFDKVINNLKFISKYRTEKGKKFKIYVSYVKTKQNKEEVDILRKIITPFVDDFVVYDVYNQGGNVFEIKDSMMLHRDYKLIKAPCSMLFNRLHITCEGYLNICCVDFQNYLAVEDLNKVSLEKAWNSERFVEIRKKHLMNDLKGTSCFNCINNCDECIEPLNKDLATVFKENYTENILYIKKRLECK